MSQNRTGFMAMQQIIEKKATLITPKTNSRKQLPKQKSPSHVKVKPII